MHHQPYFALCKNKRLCKDCVFESFYVRMMAPRGFYKTEINHRLKLACLFSSLVFILAYFSVCFTPTSQQSSIPVHLIVNGSTCIAKISRDFICATVDWWPPDNCDYGTCSWHYSSILNLDLSNKILTNAVKGLSPLTMRLGGTLQDQIVYLVNGTEDCPQFAKNSSALFRFTGGCLNMSRWKEWNDFFQKTGSVVAFGLNALYPRKNLSIYEDWDPTNTRDFIRYSHDQGFKIRAWEFGNELSGRGTGVSVPLDKYVIDVKRLRRIMDEIYAGSESKPGLVAPDGDYDADWYKDFVVESGKGVIDVLTHHIYNLGTGNGSNLTEKILDPDRLDKIKGTFKSLRNVIKEHGPWAQAWVGEAGAASHSGRANVSNAFVSGFWYVNQLGMAAYYNTSVYCRQTLIGGNYGLLDAQTFEPNPDYYVALLWKRLMGNVVLHPHLTEAPYLRAFTHCHKCVKGGLTAVFINLSNTTQYDVRISVKGGKNMQKRARYEYHLTPEDGDLHSKVVYLNGSPLRLTGSGIPRLNPLTMDSSKAICVKAWSIVYAEIRDAGVPVCVP